MFIARTNRIHTVFILDRLYCTLTINYIIGTISRFTSVHKDQLAQKIKHFASPQNFFKRGKMVDTYSQVINFCLFEYPKERDKIDKAMWPATETIVKNKTEYCFNIVTDPTPKITDKMLTRIHKQLIFFSPEYVNTIYKWSIRPMKHLRNEEVHFHFYL